MTIQQLRYVIEIAESGSLRAAAQNLFLSQPSLSKSVFELEQEMGITIFHRSSRGVALTEDGVKFLSYARQVTDQADLLERQYKQGKPVRRVFSVSAQHYAFVVNAFVAFVKEYKDNKYEFTLRETRTNDIIEDVRTARSELGIIYLSQFNREILTRIMQNADVRFTPLFTAKPHVFVGRKNPLAKKDKVTLEDLKDYPRLTYEQGVSNSFYYSEELHSTEQSDKSVVVTDRATLFNLLIGMNGYTICSGVLSADLNGREIVSVPLESDERMEIGYVTANSRGISKLGQRYIEHLKEYIYRLGI
ncbi:MAG: LysR family transcriptional regulator [Candidatus Coproplasma sp.]